MLPAPDDDLSLLATRLKLGVPLRGFDDRPIPLRDRDGASIGSVDAAMALLLSATCLLPADAADEAMARICDRAREVEAIARTADETSAVVAARVAAVLVSGAVRTAMLAKGGDTSPSGLNRATLSWYQVCDLRRRELLDASSAESFDRLSA